MDGPYNINKCLIQDTIFRDYVDYYSIEKKRETKLFVCGKDNRRFRLNLEIPIWNFLLITSREVSSPAATEKKKKRKEKGKKRLFKSMLLQEQGVWNNKDKTRDPPEASRKTKLRLSNRLSKYRDEISIDGLSGIDDSGVDRKNGKLEEEEEENFFLTRIKKYSMNYYSRNR